MHKKESKDQRGKTPETDKTTKEDGKHEYQRRKSANKEDKDKESMTQGGTALSEFGDGDDNKEGVNACNEGNDQGRWQR